MAMNQAPAGPPGSGRGTDADDRDHHLPCGNTVEQVWEHLDAGRPTVHEDECPHCSTAQAGLRQLAAATALLVDEPIEPPAGLLDTIMAAVRADLAATDTIALPAPAGGVELSTHALAAVLRFAVDRVDGLRAHRCAITVDPDHPHLVRVRMSVSLRYPTGRAAAVDSARSRVAAVLSTRIGLTLDQLDIEVTDVWIPADDPGPSS